MTPTDNARLPAGWVWVAFGDLLSEPLVNGLSIKGSEAPPGVPALKLNAMGERGFDWSKIRYLPIDWDEVSDLEIQEGDFFISRGNGSLALVGRGTSAQKPAQRVIFPDTMIRARLREPIRSTGWVQTVWACPGVREQIERRVKTTAGIWKISQGEIESIRLPLPPLSEQTRIVGEVEKQLTRLDAGVEALKRVQAQLKRYRASILKDACEGRLVPTEAELARREKRSYEPADRLLTRILKERRARWEADLLAKMKASGKPPKDDKWKAKYVEPSSPDNAALPPLPSGWVWTTLEQLAADEANSITDGPFGSNLKSGHYVESGPRVVRLQNIGEGRFFDEHAHISRDHFDRLKKHRVYPGDLVIAALSERPPRACSIPESLGDAIVKADCVRFKPDEALAHSRYVLSTLNSETTRALLRDKVHGVGRPRLNLGEIRSIAIPLPPQQEQLRIIGKVEDQFSIIDASESSVQAGLVRAAHLRRAILRLAFEGALVPQNPKDEPASKLLERISADVDNKPLPKQGRFKQTTAVPKMKAPR